MNWQQIVQPNLSVVGQSDLCLEYVRSIFGAPADYNTATDAWNGAQYKHTGEQPPTDVAAPIWFSWTGTVDGVTENYGHVACSVNGSKFYSVTATGDQIFPSLQALMDFIGGGIAYLGWSEDINTLRVVEGETMELFNEGDLENFLVPTFGAEYWLQAQQNKWYFDEIGKDFKTAMYDIFQSEQYGLALQAKDTSLNKTNVLAYIQANLN